MTTATAVPREKIVEVALDRIVPNPWQPRASMSEEYIGELMDSIDQVGLLQEPLARYVGADVVEGLGDDTAKLFNHLAALADADGNVAVNYTQLVETFPDTPSDRTVSRQLLQLKDRGILAMVKYGNENAATVWKLTTALPQVQLAFGHSRIEALRGLHAQGKWPSWVRLKIAGLTDEDMAYIALTENRARKDLTPAEEISAWAKVLREVEGVTITGLAEKVGVDRSTMSKNLAVLDLPADVLALVDDGVLSVRGARELLCMRNEDHAHEDAIELVLKALAGNGGPYATAYHIPDYRLKTVRGELRAVALGHGGRGTVSYHQMSRGWRPLQEGEGCQHISFDVDEFKRAFPHSVHTIPLGETSGGQEWTCEAKEWSKWSARATREQNAAPAGEGRQPQSEPGRKKNETEEEAWWKVVKRDPVVRAHLGRRLSRVKTARDLTKEDREALGPRVKLFKSAGDLVQLPAEAHPGGKFLSKDTERQARADRPPMFDFSQCATCTVGATWARVSYWGGYQLVCSNEKEYNDRKAQGVQLWKRQLEEQREADAEDDAEGIRKLSAVDLDEEAARVIVLSMGSFMKDSPKVNAYPEDWGWRKYNYWPNAAHDFAQMVGCQLPDEDREGWGASGRWWNDVTEFFDNIEGCSDSDLEDFRWRAALACLLVWQARTVQGLGKRMWTTVAMATA